MEIKKKKTKIVKQLTEEQMIKLLRERPSIDGVTYHLSGEQAIALIKDQEYASKRNWERVFWVVRNPRNPEVILSLNLAEAAALG